MAADKCKQKQLADDEEKKQQLADAEENKQKLIDTQFTYCCFMYGNCEYGKRKWLKSPNPTNPFGCKRNGK